MFFFISLSLQNSFEALRHVNYFVDKTLVIRKIMDLWDVTDAQSKNSVDRGRRPILITAPRRFGKTTILDLLESFFGGLLSEDSFRKMKIGNDELAFHWYGQFSVLYILSDSVGPMLEILKIASLVVVIFYMELLDRTVT